MSRERRPLHVRHWSHARVRRADEGNAMKGQQKPKKLGKKAPLKSLKEKRAAKKAAAKHGSFDA